MMVRMFHVSCDINGPDCEGDYDGDEWYAAIARKRARDDGWIRRQVDGEKKDICPPCQSIG